MKKIYFFAFLLAGFVDGNAQTLNQPAAWPNPAWTITGDYNTDPLAFEANPTTTANFAFDDDDAGVAHEDNIAAESPVINLTAAFAANEKNIEVAVSYGFRYLDYDVLQFQYWDATAAAWVAWPGDNIPGTGTEVADDFCMLPKVDYVTATLRIDNFTPAQLAGFKYRISYDDTVGEADYNYGFCFNSPTIRSFSCIAPSELLVEDVTPETADISWAAIDGIAGFELVLNQTATDPASAGTATTDLSYSAGGLTPETNYYFHIRTNCGTTFSLWKTIAFRTRAFAPANDACQDAILITGFPYTNTQDASAATNNDGFIEVCENTMNDGVWYTFTGDGTETTVSLYNVGEWDPQLDIYSGTCGAFSCVASSDGDGMGGDESITFTAEAGMTYYLNIGYYSGTEDLEEGSFSISVMPYVAPVLPANDACADAIVISSFPYTNSQDASLATNNDGFVEACEDAMNDGVWYTFTGDGSNVTVEISNIGDWDPQLDVYTGACGTFVCEASADSSGFGGSETLEIPSIAGTTYFVNIGQYSGASDNAEGPYNISVTSTGLGTTSQMGAQFKSYPNPVKDILYVSYDKNITDVSVYNMLGQKVLTKTLNAANGQVNLSSLANGTYMVKVASGVESKTTKVVKL